MAEERQQRRPFRFENAQQRGSIGNTTHRPQSRAEIEREVLLSRLGVSDADRARLDGMNDLLLRYCLEVPLNIEWYETARQQAYRRLVAFTSIIVITALAALVATVYLVFWPKETVDRAGEGFSLAQLSVAVAAVVGALQVLAASQDSKARMGIFWKASADLKELLYSFEESWRGRVVVDGKVAQDFETMLRLDLKAARKITRDEQTEFFATYKSPTELITAASSALDVLRGRGREALDDRKARIVEGNTREVDTLARITRARQAISEAAAAIEAVQYRLRHFRELKAQGQTAVSDALLGETQLELVRAHSEKRKAEALLDAILHDDRPDAAKAQ